MKTPNIINIQKFSVHDGDGIRTTIFFKGCYLNCWSVSYTHLKIPKTATERTICPQGSPIASGTEPIAA